MTFKECIDVEQQEAFDDFVLENPYVMMDGVPKSLIRLCFFSGYLSAVDCIEKIMNGDEKFTKDKDSL